MPTDYDIKSVIICDDIRQERTGKEILIGVYNDSILLGAFPARLLRLVFRVAVVPKKPNLGVFRFAVYAPSQKAIAQVSGSFPPGGSGGEPIILGLATHNFPLEQPGTYEIRFSTDADPEQKIGSFDVRTPVNTEEGQRLRLTDST